MDEDDIFAVSEEVGDDICSIINSHLESLLKEISMKYRRVCAPPLFFHMLFIAVMEMANDHAMDNKETLALLYQSIDYFKIMYNIKGK